MTFWAILILLVLVAGLVAYVGDLVAKRVGKRHWRFLGLRPKATATLVAVAVTVVLGLVVGLAVARAGGVAATMITLAVLFVVDQVVKNWTALTKGAGGLGGVPVLQGSTWLWLGAFVALVVAHGFAESRPGRLAVATREDEVAAPALPLPTLPAHAPLSRGGLVLPFANGPPALT